MIKQTLKNDFLVRITRVIFKALQAYVFYRNFAVESDG